MIELLIAEFINIWENYSSNMFLYDVIYHDIYTDIINKIKIHIELNKFSKKHLIELKLDKFDKKRFIELIETKAYAIYTINNCDIKYEKIHDHDCFQQTDIYDEPELNVCADLLNYLQFGNNTEYILK